MSFRFAKDKWLSRDGVIIVYDKLEHAVFFGALSILAGPLAASLLGLAVEIAHGFLDYRKYKFVGGEGFSWRDLVANQVGIGIAYVLAGALAAAAKAFVAAFAYL